MFYASLVLYLYIRSIPPSPPSGTTSFFSPTSSWEVTHHQDSNSPSTGLAMAPYCLDSNLHDPSVPDCSSWLTLGGPVSLSLPLPSSTSSPTSNSSPLSTSPSSIALAGPISAVQVLRATSTCLAGQSVWRIARVFAAVLDGMAKSDMAEYDMGNGEAMRGAEEVEVE